MWRKYIVIDAGVKDYFHFFGLGYQNIETYSNRRKGKAGAVNPRNSSIPTRLYLCGD